MCKAQQGLIERRGAYAFSRGPRIYAEFAAVTVFCQFFWPSISATANFAVTEGVTEKLVGEIFTFSSAFT